MWLIYLAFLKGFKLESDNINLHFRKFNLTSVEDRIENATLMAGRLTKVLLLWLSE